MKMEMAALTKSRHRTNWTPNLPEPVANHHSRFAAPMGKSPNGNNKDKSKGNAKALSVALVTASPAEAGELEQQIATKVPSTADQTTTTTERTSWGSSSSESRSSSNSAEEEVVREEVLMRTNSSSSSSESETTSTTTTTSTITASTATTTTTQPQQQRKRSIGGQQPQAKQQQHSGSRTVHRQNRKQSTELEDDLSSMSPSTSMATTTLLRRLEKEKHIINRNSTTFYHAIMTNNAAKVEKLLKTKPKCVFDVDTMCHHPVFDVVCAKPNSLPLMMKMVEELGVDPCNCECDKGTIPLYSAIMAWSTFKTDIERRKVLWLMTKAKARIDPINKRPIGSPLTKAVELGDWTLVRKLINYGANVNLITRAGLTPLCFAALVNSVPITQLLIQHGAHPDPSYAASVSPTPEVEVSSPLVQAAGEGHIEIAKVLLEHGGPGLINAVDGVEGITPLMKAAGQGRLEMCCFLIERGADVNAMTRSSHRSSNNNSKRKNNALLMARRRKHLRVVELLMQHGAQALPVEPTSPNCTVQ